jgi:hypothetical protein
LSFKVIIDFGGLFSHFLCGVSPLLTLNEFILVLLNHALEPCWVLFSTFFPLLASVQSNLPIDAFCQQRAPVVFLGALVALILWPFCLLLCLLFLRPGISGKHLLVIDHGVAWLHRRSREELAANGQQRLD